MATYKELLMTRDAFAELRTKIHRLLASHPKTSGGEILVIDTCPETGDLLVVAQYTRGEESVQKTHRITITEEPGVPHNALDETDALAARGARLLDQAALRYPHLVPADWHDRVDLDDFCMLLMDKCVLGYAMPDHSFDEACEALGLTTRAQIVAAGFQDAAGRVNGPLERAWANLILDRRAGAR